MMLDRMTTNHKWIWKGQWPDSTETGMWRCMGLWTCLWGWESEE